ncbi:unnamed protein product [Lota lota]
MSDINHLKPQPSLTSSPPEPPKKHSPLPFPLSSPLIKKKAIQLPSFQDPPLVSERHNLRPFYSSHDRCLELFRSAKESVSVSIKSSQKPYLDERKTNENRASTLPRMRSKSHTSPAVSQKPSICVLSPASKPNPPSTAPAVGPKPNICLNALDSQSHSSPLHPVTEPKPSKSPTLTVPIIRPNLSPTLLCKMMLPGSHGAKRKTILVVAEKRGVQSIVNSNTRDLPVPAKRWSPDGATPDVLDQDTLVNFTRSESGRGSSRKAFNKESKYHTACDMTSKNLWPLQCKTSFTKVKDNGFLFIEKPEITKPNVGKIVLSLQTAEKEYTQSESDEDVGKECDSLNIGSHSSSNFRLTKKYANYVENTQCTLTKSVPKTWNNFTTDSKTKKSQVEECPVKVMANTCMSGDIKALRRHALWCGILNETTDARIMMREDTSLEQDTPGWDSKQNELSGSKEQSYLVLNQTQEASQSLPLKRSKPVSLKCNSPYTSDPQLQYQLNRLDLTKSPVQSANNQRVTPSYLEPNQFKCIRPHDHRGLTQLPVYSSEKCVVSWLSSTECDPFNKTQAGTGSNELCRMPSQPRGTGPHTPVDTAAEGPAPHKQADALPSGAPITEEPEEPYYVTMYSPGTVYVSMDMSDIVPPEVRPKPVVPAKPPHGSSSGSTLLGYIGIDTIIEQMRKKTMKTGFDFNIMVVGHSGLGKSTLLNTLFKSQVSRRSAGWARDEKIPKTVEIKAVSHFIEEGGVKMKLTVVDTPGFGDQINNDNCWEPIGKYINEQYEKFLKEEVNITRKKRIPDTRVHCCLYFISPTGHSLRQLDLEFMKHLSHSVNIIPIIAKADTMTIEERLDFKQRVRKELEMGGVEYYPQKEFDEDMEDKSDNDKIREAMPLAVVGSDKEYQVNGKRVLGRKTAWGVVEVENPNHCEFAQLRDFLIRSHLQDLKEVTHNIHYETYRAKRLHGNGGLHPVSANDTQESNL